MVSKIEKESKFLERRKLFSAARGLLLYGFLDSHVLYDDIVIVYQVYRHYLALAAGI